MSSSVDKLRAVAPQFEDESDESLEVYLEMAADRLDASAWGKLFEQGAVYLAAHLLTVRNRAQQAAQHGGTAGGGVTSVSEGDQSISYAEGGKTASTPSEEALSSTQYGQQFLSLRNQLAAGSGFVADGSY